MKWTDIKIEQIESGRDKCEAPFGGCEGGLEAHHAIFSRSKQHPEYDCKENMLIVCHKHNYDRRLNNENGKLWSMFHNALLFGEEHMRSWLETLKDTHKDWTDIEFLIRELEG